MMIKALLHGITRLFYNVLRVFPLKRYRRADQEQKAKIMSPKFDFSTTFSVYRKYVVYF